MKKGYVIKNSENNKYFTGDYDGFWSLDIHDSKWHTSEHDAEVTIGKELNSDNGDESFENIQYVIIETIFYISHK